MFTKAAVGRSKTHTSSETLLWNNDVTFDQRLGDLFGFTFDLARKQPVSPGIT